MCVYETEREMFVHKDVMGGSLDDRLLDILLQCETLPTTAVRSWTSVKDYEKK